ncbi:MAG: hypothetical protein HY261_10195, partial [Chloroflexi bacterium]|nr:hypothetical protein [Chloroflexota bacterium]
MNLDEQKVYERLDEQGMAAHIAGLPGQCRRAWDEAMAFELPKAYGRAKSVAMLGMGGSAVGGNLASGMQAIEGGCRVEVIRGYHLPE